MTSRRTDRLLARRKLATNGATRGGSSARSRLLAEHGASFVEAALITPIFFMLIFGVIEWGLTFHARLSVENMALVGARTGSAEGSDALADYRTLQAVGSATSGVATSRINSIVIYKASGPGDPVPESCRSGSVLGVCNRYVAADLARSSADFGCSGPTAIDISWCPSDRKTTLTGSNGPPDYLAVYVEADHDTVTGFFGPGFTFHSDTVMRLEPRTLT